MQTNKKEWTIPSERKILRETMEHVINPAMAVGKEYVVQIKELKKSKTYKQCKGWHRLLNVIANHLNEHNFDDKFWDAESVKFIVKHVAQFGELRCDVFIPRSFAGASKEEAIHLINVTQQLAIDDFGINSADVQLDKYELQMLEEYYKDELQAQ